MAINAIRKVKKILGIVLETAGGLLLWGIAYFILLFKNMPGQTAEKSLAGVFVLAVVWTLLVLEQSHIEKKKLVSRWLMPAIPFGLYTIFAYRQDYQALIWGCLGFALVISVFIGLCLFMRPIKNQDNKLDILISRVSRCIRRVMWVFTCVLMVIMAVISVNTHRLAKVMRFTYVKVIASSEPAPEYTFEKNIDMFLKLHWSLWPKLSIEERLETLQKVTDIETHTYLGIQEQIVVQVEPLDYILGEFVDAERIIKIDLDHLENDHVWSVMDTLLNKIFEAYTQKILDKGCDEYVEARTEIYRYNAAWYEAYQNGTPLGG